MSIESSDNGAESAKDAPVVRAAEGSANIGAAERLVDVEQTRADDRATEPPPARSAPADPPRGTETAGTAQLNAKTSLEAEPSSESVTPAPGNIRRTTPEQISNEGRVATPATATTEVNNSVPTTSAAERLVDTERATGQSDESVGVRQPTGVSNAERLVNAEQDLGESNGEARLHGAEPSSESVTPAPDNIRRATPEQISDEGRVATPAAIENETNSTNPAAPATERQVDAQRHPNAVKGDNGGSVEPTPSAPNTENGVSEVAETDHEVEGDVTPPAFAHRDTSESHLDGESKLIGGAALEGDTTTPANDPPEDNDENPTISPKINDHPDPERGDGQQQEPTETTPDESGGVPEGMPPAVWKRIQEGNQFNVDRRPFYPYYEVRLDNGKIVDSYEPGSWIVERKHSQLADVQEQTAIKYIQDVVRKYSPGEEIADTPRNKEHCNELIGEALDGQMVLEVPVQCNPVPSAVLEAADEAGVIIRDTDGRRYKA